MQMRWLQVMKEDGHSSYLYLLTHPDLNLHKVGIGTVGKDKGRMQQYLDQGWLSQGIWRHSDKRRTFQWEKEIFAQLQQRFTKLNNGETGFVGKSDKHWFEGVSAGAISSGELSRLISTVVGQKP
jgi:hypothetical protein